MTALRPTSSSETSTSRPAWRGLILGASPRDQRHSTRTTPATVQRKAGKHARRHHRDAGLHRQPVGAPHQADEDEQQPMHRRGRKREARHREMQRGRHGGRWSWTIPSISLRPVGRCRPRTRRHGAYPKTPGAHYCVLTTSTVAQPISGSKLVMVAARAAVSGPRSFWNTTPSASTRKVITPETR